jgi:hypothetical protein
MKTYTIDIERRDSLLDTLWGNAERASEVSVLCKPASNQVFIIGADGKTLAIINLVKVSDEYDVISEIL